MYKIEVSYITCNTKDVSSALLSCVECDYGDDTNIFRMPTKEVIYSPHLFIGPFSNTELLSNRISAVLDHARSFVLRRRSHFGNKFTITI